MRKERRNLLLALLVAVVVMGGLGWLIFRNQEPVYKGKRLSEWLHENNASDGGLNSSVQEAFRQIGTNAIPTLLRMLHAHDSKLKLELIGLARKQHFMEITFVPAADQNLEATMGFARLGANASNAVPALIQIYEEKISDVSQTSAAYSLGFIGPASRPAVPALLRSVGNTNADASYMRGLAAWTLGAIHSEPELVVPALIGCLRDFEPGVRAKAAVALASFGSDAKAAVPALVELLKDSDANVSGQAGRTLKRIDPEAAARAGVK